MFKLQLKHNELYKQNGVFALSQRSTCLLFIHKIIVRHVLEFVIYSCAFWMEWFSAWTWQVRTYLWRIVSMFNVQNLRFLEGCFSFRAVMERVTESFFEAKNATSEAGSLLLEFSWIDYLLFCAMFGLSAIIGVYFGCFGSKQSSIKDYLLGGKSMSIFPIAMSLTARYTPKSN